MTDRARPGLTSFTAADKARLIEQALDTLRGANAIDERETLTAETWLSWYDATIPTVTEIKVLAAAMERELEVRRGEAVVQEGERRGGDYTSAESKVSHRDTLLNATRVARRKDRQLGLAAPQVRAWIAREATAGRVPTRRGALTVAGIALKRTSPATVRPATKAQRSTPQYQTGQVKSERRVETILAAVDAVADGTPRTDPVLRRAIRHHGPLEIDTFLQATRLIPWLTIARDATGTTFTIDHELRDICDGRAPRPTLEGQSIRDFLRTLRAEITRRRKENHDEYNKRKWRVTEVRTREQTLLLNWIEEQLDRVP